MRNLYYHLDGIQEPLGFSYGEDSDELAGIFS